MLIIFLHSFLDFLSIFVLGYISCHVNLLGDYRAPEWRTSVSVKSLTAVGEIESSICQ